MPTTFVATPQPGNDPPRVLLELEYTGQTEATVTRLDPDGREQLVRLGEPAPLVGGLWTGYDYESWFGQPATYTAATAGGSITATPVTLTVDAAWLRHPGVPDLSILVHFEGEGDPVRAVNQAILEPLGRRDPIVVSDGRRKSKRGTLTLRTYDSTELAALLGILDDVTPLLLDVPPDWAYGLDHQYLAIGDLTENRFRPDYYPHQWRVFTAPYVVVGRPAGGLQAEWTYADVLAMWGTYTDVRNNYDTHNDLLTGTEN